MTLIKKFSRMRISEKNVNNLTLHKTLHEKVEHVNLVVVCNSTVSAVSYFVRDQRKKTLKIMSFHFLATKEISFVQKNSCSTAIKQEKRSRNKKDISKNKSKINI